MRYRTPKAQSFHSSLMVFVRTPSSEQNKLDVETLASNLDFKSITELSINGHSHLIDVLHLPFEIIEDKKQASRVTNHLMGLLLSKARAISGALNCLLLQKDNAGFTPLHEALISGNADNMRAYFAEVRQAVTDRTITAEEYKQLLTGANAAGFTPLHQAANSGIYEIYSEYRKALTEFDCDGSATRILLFAETKNGYTPSCQPGFDKKDCGKINRELNAERAKLRSQGDIAQTASASSAQSQKLFRPQSSNPAGATNSNLAFRR